ncbi:MAG: FG-GAP-like repeat-containing protein [Pyrinomonadaceae bacterium]
MRNTLLYVVLPVALFLLSAQAASAQSFAPAVNYPSAAGAQAVAVGDFNVDGKPDLAVVNYNDSTVSVLFRNNIGTFAAKIDYGVKGVAPASVAVGDFNLDGKPDLIVSNFNSNSVSELINLASAPTSAPSSINGQVNTPDGAPLPGAVVTLSGAHSAVTITDSLGKFHFDNLDLGGFYILTPRFASYSFAPENRAYSLAGNVTDATFTATPDAIPTANPLDTSEYFVRQQYIDFLEREPDAGGFAYWSSQFDLCGNDASCLRQTRINVSAAFFIEAEFQQTGSFIYRLYKAGLGRRLNYAEFNRDRAQIIGGAQLDQQRAAFVNAFVERADFQQRYADAQTAETFVERLIASVWDASAVDLGAERSILLAQYHAGANVNESRAIVLHSVVEDGQLKRAEYDKSFVLMQYYGYLRRDVDEGGYQFWLNVLDNREPNNYRGMVCSFITSAEYQQRFSSVTTHSNAECK